MYQISKESKKPPILSIAFSLLCSISIMLPIWTGIAHAESNGGVGSIKSSTKTIEKYQDINGDVSYGKQELKDSQTDLSTSNSNLEYVVDDDGNVNVKTNKYATSRTDENNSSFSNVGVNSASGEKGQEQKEPDTFTSIRSNSNVGTKAENVDVSSLAISNVDFDKISEEQKASTLNTICTKINGFDEKTCNENKEVIAKCGDEKGTIEASKCIDSAIHGNVEGVEKSQTQENVGIFGSVLGILDNIKEKVGNIGLGILGVLGLGAASYASYGFITKTEEKDTYFVQEDEYGSTTGTAKTFKQHHTNMDGSQGNNSFGEEVTKFSVSALDTENNLDSINGIVSSTEADDEGVRYGQYTYESSDGSKTMGNYKADSTGNTEFVEKTLLKDGKTISTTNSVQYNSEATQEEIISEIASGRNRTKVVQKAIDNDEN